MKERYNFTGFGVRYCAISLDNKRKMFMYGCDGTEHGIWTGTEKLNEHGDTIYAWDHGVKIIGKCTGSCKGKNPIGGFLGNDHPSIKITKQLVIEPIPEDADVRVCMESFNKEGVLVQRSYGMSPTELQQAHDNHQCGWLCAICYDEAMRTIDKGGYVPNKQVIGINSYNTDWYQWGLNCQILKYDEKTVKGILKTGLMSYTSIQDDIDLFWKGYFSDTEDLMRVYSFLCTKDPDTCNSIPPGGCGVDCHGFKPSSKIELPKCAKNPDICNSIPPGSCGQNCHGYVALKNTH